MRETTKLGFRRVPPSPPPPPPARRLAHTIRRSRWLNLLTRHAKPHPKLRFTSLTPTPVEARAVVGAAGNAPSAARGGGAGVTINSAL